MNPCFRSCDILLPRMKNFDRWSVIACDQHTSDQGYWEQVADLVGDDHSALKIMLPEVYLEHMNDAMIRKINTTMAAYLEQDVLQTYRSSFVYVERQLTSGAIRQGIVGMIDLERYSVPPMEDTKVFATEGVVPERLPPRIRIRKEAPLEISHCVIFCDDPADTLMGSVASKKDQLEKLYDLDLMMGGGHITGWLIAGEDAEQLEYLLAKYEEDNIYLVGDGNHSLLTAKKCYEEKKASYTDREALPARYAMVELENIHSDAMCFEPIYRVVTETDAASLWSEMERLSVEDGVAVQMVMGTQCREIRLPVQSNELVVGVLQKHLDQWLADNAGMIDYIHGKDVVMELAQQPNAVGFLLPDFDKAQLFPYIHSGNITPRKTFSIGHASEKRYYMEGRKIL